MNKNQLRETLRKHIHDASYLDAGVERIVDQVVNPKVYSVFMPQIEDVVYKFLGIERPKAKEKNGACGLKDLLPKDLDPVSPESDKNSLKDESLESMDINDINNLDGKQDEKVDEQKPQEGEIYKDKNRAGSENGYISLEEKTSDEACKILNKDGSNSNLNTSAKSDDKVDEEEEEVSPTFEPIDIMNLNESNISNDSHLSGISELTSHRSRSPDFSNELSRDNFEYSNQDSQLSKVSSDSRLSIVTDFGSSNHALTPAHDSSRDETTKDKGEVFTKNNKDNFKAIREFDSSKNKSTKSSFDFAKGKDVQDYKDTKDFKSTKSVSSKENSRDATDNTIKDKYEHKNKEKSKDSESTKSSKSTKEKAANKETKYYKDKSTERKKSSSEKYDKHNNEKYDKHSKSKPKDKIDQVKESSDKIKDIPENLKDNSNKLKDEKPKEMDKKDNVNKEVKDLKDIYKEKIRELREKKELTEKEKLNKDKDVKLIKETKDKKDPLKDKKSNKKEHKSSSSSSSSSKNPMSHHESKSSKTSEKIVDGKDKRSDSKDKAKRDEKRLLKESKGKSHYSSKSDLSDKSDKSDSKKASRSEKEDKGGKVDVKKDVKASSEKATNGKKDVKSHLQQGKSSDRAEKSDGRKESKSDSPSKDKKRRDDKKSKTKDDHSSLRKNSNDRRSTDRDGSNGSSNKTSPSSNSNSNVTSNKSNTSNLTKDNHVSNSGSETSDGIEETQVNDSKLLHCKLSNKISSQLLTNEKSYSKVETDNSNEVYDKQEEENADPRDINLPLKKRLLSDKDDDSIPDVKLKKPKFAKNIHEAKKLMKIRKQMEKQKLKEDKKVEKKIVQEADQTSQSNTKNADNLEGVPDDERVQIIEIPDEEYEEPYPEKDEPPLMLDERSIIMPGTESCTNDLLKELCIRQSSSGIVSNAPLEETQATQDSKTDEKHDTQRAEGVDDSQVSKKRYKDDIEEDSKNKALKRLIVDEENRLQADETSVLQMLEEAAAPEKSKPLEHEGNSNVKRPTEENMETRDYNQVETQNDNEEVKNDNPLEIRDDNKELPDEKQTETYASSKADTIDSHTDCMENKSSSSTNSEDNEDCRYFKTDNEKSERFSNFLESLELVENSSLEDIIESLGGKVVSSIPKSMAAPPLPKLRKRSSSPLSDILVNNSDNNNDGYKQKLSSLPNEDAVSVVKKRKYTKKPRFSNVCSSQGISNGENFVMPLSPDSDVSATSDKTASTNVIKEEKRYVTFFSKFLHSAKLLIYLLYLFCYTCFVSILQTRGLTVLF